MRQERVSDTAKSRRNNTRMEHGGPVKGPQRKALVWAERAEICPRYPDNPFTRLAMPNAKKTNPEKTETIALHRRPLQSRSRLRTRKTADG
jgi:hypothetical protein